MPANAAAGVATQAPCKPSGVCGVWKAAARSVNTGTNAVTVTPRVDPAKNNYNLGRRYPGRSVPVGRSIRATGLRRAGAWTILASHVLQAGHTYRLQFMVHDGDQNKTGGDVGQACVNLDLP